MKRLLKISFLSTCIAAAFYFSTSENEEVHDLVFNNIEALASGEGSSDHCFGSGSVDCRGYKVDWKISGYSLDDFE